MTDRLEFSRKTKAKRFAFCNGRCENCSAYLVPGKFQYDHDKEAADGGDNSFENCRVLCDNCHKPKTKQFVVRIRKADRQRDKNSGAFRRVSRFPCSRDSRWKKKINGQVVER